MELVNIDQERARFALEKIKRLKEVVKGEEAEKYRAYVRRLPSMILRNGLGLTLAFIKGKGGTHELIYNHLQQWFVKKKFINEGDDLLEKLLRQNAVTYRNWTKEALAFAIWLQRMAEAEIEEVKKKE